MAGCWIKAMDSSLKGGFRHCPIDDVQPSLHDDCPPLRLSDWLNCDLCDLGQYEYHVIQSEFSVRSTSAADSLRLRFVIIVLMWSQAPIAAPEATIDQNAVILNDAIHGILAKRIVDFVDYDHGSDTTANESIPPSGKHGLADLLKIFLLLFFRLLLSMSLTTS